MLEDLNPIFVSEDDVFIQGGALRLALEFLVSFVLLDLFFGVFDFFVRVLVCFDVFEFPDLGVLDVVSLVGDEDDIGVAFVEFQFGIGDVSLCNGQEA